MTSGDNNFNYFPENQLTKFIAVPPPKISMTQRASSPLGWTPLRISLPLNLAVNWRLHVLVDCVVGKEKNRLRESER